MYLISSLFKNLLICNVCKKQKSEIEKEENKNKVGAAVHFQYGTSSLNLPCMWVGLSSYQSVVINGELTNKVDPLYFLLPPGLC